MVRLYLSTEFRVQNKAGRAPCNLGGRNPRFGTWGQLNTDPGAAYGRTDAQNRQFGKKNNKV